MDLIRDPAAESFPDLCEQLAASATELERPGAWPSKSLELCGDGGVYRWFHEERWGGFSWTERDIIEGYLQLSTACLTTTFVITQRTGACQRIERSANESLKAQLLPQLVRGELFATVGISHLTTSRQHFREPVLRAREAAGDVILNGFSPWVTGVPHADVVVTGATYEDGRQILLALPTDLAGIEIPETPELVGLSASRTGKLVCNDVRVPAQNVLYGPAENVMRLGAGGNTGGLQTSTLALGLASAAIDYLEEQSEARDSLELTTAALRSEWLQSRDNLLLLAEGGQPCSNEELRTSANRLALHATQSALTAAKGTGYLVGHPAGRWCREALFFLVWSCPQPVAQAHLCELAGLQE